MFLKSEVPLYSHVSASVDQEPSTFISQKVLIKLSCTSRFSHKSVNRFFIITKPQTLIPEPYILHTEP